MLEALRKVHRKYKSRQEETEGDSIVQDLIKNARAGADTQSQGDARSRPRLVSRRGTHDVVCIGATWN